MAHDHLHHPHGPQADDAPLDAANQSLADALRASFSILKFIMFVLVVMYCFSGVQCIDQNEEAVVFRFGRLLPETRAPGLRFAFPYPIDETLKLPTKKSNEFTVWAHWPKVPAGKENESLDKVRMSGGLKPGLDGSLLTADSGMVHIVWRVTYRINDLENYVRYVADQETADVVQLIQDLLESAAVRVVAQHDAESVTRGMSREIANAVRAQVNADLETLGSGVEVVALDIPRSSVPGQTIEAFNEVSKAENERRKTIADARQKRDEVLNAAAGPVWKELLAYDDEETGERRVGLLDKYDGAVAARQTAEAEELWARIERIIEHEAGGTASEAIRRANSFYTQVVQHVQSDAHEYDVALAEYQESRTLFINRMWERTKAIVLQYDGLKKHFIAERADEIRIKVGPDPEQRKIDERERLRREEEEKYDYTGPKQLHAFMPGMEGHGE